MPYFVYMVQASDGSLYTGYSTNVERRVFNHNAKKGAKALKGKLPVELVFQEEFLTKSEALKREAEIKSFSKAKKLLLIKVSI